MPFSPGAAWVVMHHGTETGGGWTQEEVHQIDIETDHEMAGFVLLIIFMVAWMCFIMEKVENGYWEFSLQAFPYVIGAIYYLCER
ncbi:hypothetical protein [Fimbriiglobus ruber]|nr:hypothetical protein [Fimbriiglobus ruber]